MPDFRYCEVGDALVEELCAHILGARSLFLLGPRFSGRRALLREIGRTLTEAGISPIIDLPVLEGPQIETEEDLTRRLSTTVQPHLHRSKIKCPGLLGPIESLSIEQNKRIVFIVSNLDRLPYHVSMRLLQNVRSLEQSGRITSIIAGGAQIRELIREAKPGASLPATYVIQGLSRERFDSRIRHSIHLLGLDVRNEVALCNELWQQTKGNIYLERLIFNSFIEARLDYVTDSTIFAEKQSVTVTEVQHVLRTISPLSSKLHIDAVQALSRDGDALRHLELLLDHPFGGSIQIPFEDGSPTVLELTGLVHRAVAANVGEDVGLEFTSPLVETLARKYFDPIRLGDLKAENGEWDMAFQAYSRASPERRIRPCNDDDRVVVSAIVRRLGDRMRAAAEVDVSGVDRLFEHGCQYVLGYRNIIATYWQANSTAKWEPMEPPTPSYGQLFAALGSDIPEEGYIDLPSEAAQWMRAFVLPETIDRRRVVIIGDLAARTPISQSRFELLADLCRRYISAREAALDMERHRRRFKVFQQELNIIGRIFDALSEETMDVDSVLRFAAEEMAKLGYQVIAFGAPDLEDKAINCIQYFDNSHPALPSNQWPDPVLVDRHLAVFREGQHWLFPTSDASHEMLILPLYEGPHTPQGTDRGKVVATMQVERGAKGHFSDEEIDDLRFFGGYLISGTAQSTRNQLLQHALARISEPVLISDHQSRLRYANPEAAKLFDVRSAWYDSSKAPPLPLDPPLQCNLQLLRDALSEHKETIAYRLGVGNNCAYRGRVTTAPITNSRQSPIGALLHVQDLNETYSILSALEQVVSAKDEAELFQLMLSLTAPHGHEWARVYLVRENFSVLEGRYMRGDNPHDVKRFETGAYRIPNVPKYQWSWSCFEHGLPVILMAVSDKETRALGETKFGLPVLFVRESPWQDFLAKQPGDMWMDFALRVAGHPYAKFSLNCSDDIRPETFEFWSAVATVASSVLELLDRATAERVYISQWLLHNIQSMLAPLSGVHEKYREYAEAVVSEKLHGYNGELLEIFNEAFDRAEQRKRFFRKIAIASQPFDFPAMLHSILQRRRIGQRSGVFGTSLVFHGDKEILRDALEEMLNNSMREYQQMLARSVAGEYDDRPTIMIRLERFSRPGDPRNWIRLVFEDNGPGIPANKALTIFNGSKNGHERGGFGLLFVADVIRAHGGSIRVVPTSGRGATFEIEMPEQTQEQEDSNATLVV